MNNDALKYLLSTLCFFVRFLSYESFKSRLSQLELLVTWPIWIGLIIKSFNFLNLFDVKKEKEQKKNTFIYYIIPPFRTRKLRYISLNRSYDDNVASGYHHFSIIYQKVYFKIQKITIKILIINKKRTQSTPFFYSFLSSLIIYLKKNYK